MLTNDSSFRCDAYAAGIICAELSNPGVELYRNLNNIKIQRGVVEDNLRPPLGHNLPPSLSQLITAMMETDPLQRPNDGSITAVFITHFDEMEATGTPRPLGSISMSLSANNRFINDASDKDLEYSSLGIETGSTC